MIIKISLPKTTSRITCIINRLSTCLNQVSSIIRTTNSNREARSTSQSQARPLPPKPNNTSRSQKETCLHLRQSKSTIRMTSPPLETNPKRSIKPRRLRMIKVQRKRQRIKTLRRPPNPQFNKTHNYKSHILICRVIKE